MKRHFSLDMSGLLFVRNVMLFSIAALLPILLVYVLIMPGFASALLGGGPALWRFLRQVLTNGLPVVFVVNYVGFFLYALSQDTGTKGRDPAVYLLLDFAVRVLIFLLLHAVIYVLSADWFDSFGGSRITALRVVAPTLARSALFENISGVYLYATLISALPLYVSCVGQSPRLHSLVEAFPFRSGRIAIALIWFALAVASLSLISGFIVSLQN
tara:strand:- start:76 stop:717 length:642 start_codon:yes stop_codon:yes gene_type:complete